MCSFLPNYSSLLALQSTYLKFKLIIIKILILSIMSDFIGGDFQQLPFTHGGHHTLGDLCY